MTKSKLIIQNVIFENEKVIFQLSDGRIIGCPISWFSRLSNATEKQRKNWEIIAFGTAVEWIEIDEHLSLEGMFTFSK